jgi:hypothetical protein
MAMFLMKTGVDSGHQFSPLCVSPQSLPDITNSCTWFHRNGVAGFDVGFMEKRSSAEFANGPS